MFSYVYDKLLFSFITEDRLDHPIWWHYMTITIPDKITYKDAAFMLIDGGSNNDG